MNNPPRRDFLKLCGWAGIGFAAHCALPATSRGERNDEPYPGPYYIVFNASGGWDTTYLMDPKGTGGMNRLYEQGDILTQGAHKYAPTAKHKTGGLSNEDFYAEFGDELLVLNGLDYSVNNHSPGARYMATGKLDSLAYPTFAALVAACSGPTCPLAFLTFGNYSATGNVVAMSRVPYISSLQKIANADAVEGNERSPYHDRFALDRIERALEATYQARIEESNVPRLERAQSMLYAAQSNSKALQRVTPHIPKTMPKERLSQQVDIALSSFKAGVCVSANLSIGQFDSHANNDSDQMKLIPEFLAGIAYLMHRAEELKIREQIVVVVQSEMGRTPNYNSGNGKDHWSIGSVMFLGHGIKGNRVLGATDDKLFQVSINPRTLALDAEGGVRVRPEHIHHALREHAGIVDHPFCKKFPFEIPEKDTLQGLWG
jgi:uncharacterized protein (DUF1501 family)